jgi:predicted dehydrogenase
LQERGNSLAARRTTERVDGPDGDHEVPALSALGLRAGIVGTGFMADVHAHAVRAAGGRVERVLGSSPATTAAGAERLGSTAASGLDELVDSVDVVHVCTPNRFHLEQARTALDAGRHVVCEKPLATSVADARLLVGSARGRAVVASVPFVYRFYASVREARARIEASNEPLWLLHGSYLQDWLSSAEATNWRVDPEVGGDSRAFGDIGVHWCDLLEFTTGHRIVRLCARLARAHARRGGPGADAEVGTEDGAVVLFETDRGATGSVVLSQATPGRKNRLWFSFDGPDASYAFDQERPDELWVGGRALTAVVARGAEGTGAAAAAYSRLPSGHPQGYQDAFDAYVADVYRSVSGDVADGLPTFEDGLRAAVLTEAVVRSAASGDWVEVGA